MGKYNVSTYKYLALAIMNMTSVSSLIGEFSLVCGSSGHLGLRPFENFFIVVTIGELDFHGPDRVKWSKSTFDKEQVIALR